MEFFKLSRTKCCKILLLISLLAGCSQFNPYVDRRREAGAQDEEHLYVGASKPNKPAICYNALYNEYTEVKLLADEECKKHGTGTEAVPTHQTIFTCKLLTPNHIYFKCIN